MKEVIADNTSIQVDITPHDIIEQGGLEIKATGDHGEAHVWIMGNIVFPQTDNQSE